MFSIPQKFCTKCGSEKPLSEFSKSGPGYLRADCKACVRLYRASRREHNSWISKNYRAQNKEAIRSRYEDRKIAPPKEKLCTNCGQVKLAAAFYQRLVSADGLQGHCQECHVILARTYNRKSRLKHRDKKRAYGRLYHRRTFRQKGAQRRAQNREWKARNRLRVTIAERHRRALKYQASGFHTLQQWQDLCARYNHLCLCCGEAKPLTADHIVPLSKGGADDISNIQPLCRECNSSKKDRTIDYRGQLNRHPPQRQEAEHAPRDREHVDGAGQGDQG